MIKLERVSKTFKGKTDEIHAVDDVSLEIKQGEIFGVIGFSGAGKSTLVRCINLLERPTSGKVYVDGRELTGLSKVRLRDARKKIGMIFQHFNLLTSRTVYQNIAFPLKKTNLSKEQQRERILSLLELVGLSEKRDAYPSQLSGGQKQRVAIARALSNEPKVLLCDEPTSALDPQTTKSILLLLKKLNRELGLTIVLITHEMAVVRTICDRAAIMDKGKIIEYGDVEEIFCAPRSDITRRFIDTADNMDKIFGLINENSRLTRIKDGEMLVLLTYRGGSAEEALISHLAQAFGVTANIIYGNVDILKGKLIGKLIVILRGENCAMQQAVDYIRQRNVKLEVIRQ